MKVKTADGTWITGADAADVVKQMNRASEFSREPTPEEYMEATAKRVATQSGAKIRTGSAEEFLADLSGARMIQVEQC